MNTDSLDDIRTKTDAFALEEGRRPRVLLASMDLASLGTNSLRIYAAAFADAGYDVDVSPQGLEPKEIARAAAENDVHLVGLYSQAAGNLNAMQMLKEELNTLGRADMDCFARVAEGQATPWLELGALACFSPATDVDFKADINFLTQHLISSYI